jgi:SNF2 family DNA or RNA helicase
MMDKFKETAFVHVRDPSALRGRDRLHSFGDMLFFLRSICLRHSQDQTYRFTKTTLMSLPPKTERMVEIDFHPPERQLYLSLENEAKSFYQCFKAERQGCVSAHYLMLTQKLNQSRIACSGGHYPLEDEDKTKEDTHVIDEEDNNLSDVKTKTMKTQKAGRKYAAFAFQSKFDTLINELQTTKDKDPTCECGVCALIHTGLTVV